MSASSFRASSGKVETGFPHKRCDHKHLKQAARFRFRAACFRHAALSLLALATPAAAQQPAPIPTIHFVYPGPSGTVFDRSCENWLHRKTAKADVDEVLARKPEFEAQWKARGEEYLRIAVDGAGAPFPYAAMQATLTVCAPDSMGMPLLIQMNDFLSSNTSTPYAHDFALLVFHEVMHHYSLGIEAVSPLRKKYAAEPADVLNHLHVIAFEQYVLTKTGRIAEREKLKNYYSTYARPPYRRAWEIAEKETPEAVIAELRLLNTK